MKMYYWVEHIQRMQKQAHQQKKLVKLNRPSLGLFIFFLFILLMNEN